MRQAWVWLCVVVALAWADLTVWAQDKSVGDLAEEAAQDIMATTGLISVLFYVVGVILVGVGLLKLRRHSDQPQQVTLGSGIMWIVIGVALIAAPWIINALAETFGVDAGGSGPAIDRPALN